MRDEQDFCGILPESVVLSLQAVVDERFYMELVELDKITARAMTHLLIF